MTQPVLGRLAPSPTGALHLGNARSFLLAWLSVRQQSGRLILRIEDIDSPRVKPWATQATLDDLRWLGIDWDVGPDTQANQSAAATGLELIQSLRLARYQHVLSELIAQGVVYPCSCSRSEINAAASAPHESSLQAIEGPIYPGTCRVQPVDPQTLDQTDSYAWRWRFQEGQVEWYDCLLGRMSAFPDQQLGDFVIARGDGKPAYQLAVVVDDFDMGVTEIVRGDDLLPSTYRQLAILKHMHWPIPNYYHVPLIVGPDGRRLAKRHGDTRLSYYREQGVSPERLVGYLAWTLHLQPRPEPLHARQLIGRLDWHKLPDQPTVFHDRDLENI